MPPEAAKGQRWNLGRQCERVEALRFSQSLEPIYDLNRRMLGLLAEPMDEGTHHDFQLGTPISHALREMDSSIREQIALCPFLLVDASLSDATKWKLSEYAERVPPHLDGVTRVLELARATCVLSWYLLRTDELAARLILGVSQDCAAVIAQSGLTELQQIAARLVQQRSFKPRWHDRPDIWRQLIRLAQMTPPKPVAIHGLQVFLGDLLGRDVGR
jgi:hypothetical protein